MKFSNGLFDLQSVINEGEQFRFHPQIRWPASAPPTPLEHDSSVRVSRRSTCKRHRRTPSSLQLTIQTFDFFIRFIVTNLRYPGGERNEENIKRKREAVRNL